MLSLYLSVASLQRERCSKRPSTSTPSRSFRLPARMSKLETVAMRYFYKVASQPLWARAFYDLIATPASIHTFLQGSFVGEVPVDLERYSYLSAHQPGAEHAPLRFISGKLFTPQVRERVYQRLSVPTLVLFDQDAFVGFEALPLLLSANPNVQAVRLTPSRGLPQLETPERTAEVLREFWQGLQKDARATSQKRMRTVDSGLSHKRKKRTIPKDRGFDDSLAVLNEGYTFISKRCNELQTDVFQTRLLLQKNHLYARTGRG